tara:strand:+ start:281 stop:889 length:609 start_codon:yes stop_codon:yes gene_type:complete
MKNIKFILYVISFLIISLLSGIAFAYFAGGTIHERSSIGQSKSFEADQSLIWAALLDIESYPLWKPNLKTIEMLGTNEKGYTKWREFYPYGKSVTYEITEYIPKSLIEMRIVEAKNSAEGVWIYKLSNYQDRGVLQIKRFAIIKSHIDRFIRRWIDTKYNEVDYLLMSLNVYLDQLIEDQEEILEIMVPDSVENTEKPLTES